MSLKFPTLKEGCEVREWRSGGLENCGNCVVRNGGGGVGEGGVGEGGVGE